MKKIFLVIMLGLACMLSAACQQEDASGEAEGKIGSPAAAAGGSELNISVTSFSNINPLLTQNESVSQALNLVYEGLFEIDSSGEVQAVLADSYSWDGSRSTVAITLKSGVKWHDGRELTAEDVKFTIDLIKTMPESPYYIFASSIKAVQEKGSGNVLIEFAAPGASQVEKLVFPIVPKHKLLKLSKEQLLLDKNNMIGCGKYEISEFNKRKLIKLKSFEGYYGKRPSVEGINILIVPDIQAQKEYFQSQEIDFYNDEQYYDKKYGKLGIKVYDYFNYGFDILAFNLGKGSFADAAFRKALASAIDREKIAGEAYMGYADVADLPIIPKSGSKDKKLNAYKHNPESAKVYFKKNPDKKMPLRLLVNGENEQRVKAASVIKKNLTDAGVEIEVVEKPWEEYSQDLKSGNYDMALAGYKLPAAGQLGYVLGTQGGGNFMGFSDPGVDTLIAGIESSVTGSEKAEKVSKLQSAYNSKMPYLGLVMKKSSAVVNSRISGAFKPSEYNVYMGIEDVAVEK